MAQNVRDQLERKERNEKIMRDRDIAKYLAINTQMPPSMICKHLVVPEDTVKGWRRKARRNTEYRRASSVRPHDLTEDTTDISDSDVIE